MKYILAIDQGTSGSKAIIFGQNGEAAATVTVSLSSHFFGNGFVEQNPSDIVETTLQAVKEAVSKFTDSGYPIENIVAAGISNQRESFLLWDSGGKPLTNVVVWQCKRSIGICERIRNTKQANFIQERSGLPVDPYFSGTKVAWLLENNSKLKAMCEKREVLFGTIDTWLLYNLTNGREYKTDCTNASRTLFFNLDTLSWDSDLLEVFGASGLKLPEICRSSHSFGTTSFSGIFPREIPITAMIGDSHGASFGEGCFFPGTVKATMGTGSSVLMNTGSKRTRSRHGMVETICWTTNNRIDYALEGIIVSCGSTVNWLQKQLGIVANGKDFDIMAESVPDSGGVTFLPAFSGLGGPHWQMDRRAEIRGIDFGTTAAHIVRAALEAYPFQLRDVTGAMGIDMGCPIAWIKADGGLTNSNLTMQYIADLLETRVIIDERKEASAFGAALLAFLGAGILSFDEIEQVVSKSQYTAFNPSIPEATGYIKNNYARWLDVVNRR